VATRQKLNQAVIFTTTFGTYTASYIVGEGGSGRIFEAVDDAGETWAVKWLDTAKATKEKVKRFKNEIHFCLRSRHPHIVTVTDHGIAISGAVNAPFYVMPLFDGSLRDLLTAGIPHSKALPYFAQVLDGVEAAHLSGVVHRDLKPENILHNAANDHLVVADFGIAHFEEEELVTAVETKDSSRLANFQYAAPEQRIRGLQADQRADVFALGLILNEMFTGEVPSGTGYKTISRVAPDYEYLDSLVEEMIRQSPEDRPNTVEAVKNRLIGRRNEFVVRQRISELQKTVVPVTVPDDPLIADPPRLVNFDWRENTLTLFFQRPVNDKWIWAMRNIGNYTSLVGRGPGTFTIRGDKTTVHARESEVKSIIEYFQSWLPKANKGYEERILREQREAEARQREELERQIAEEEARQRLLKNIKL